MIMDLYEFSKELMKRVEDNRYETDEGESIIYLDSLKEILDDMYKEKSNV